MQTSIDHFVSTLLDDIRHHRLKLPILPEVALKVREAVSDSNAPAARIAKIVSADTALSARLIQVANSPLFRGTNRIESVQTAIARLGVPQVRSLVTSLIMQQMYRTQVPALRQRMKQLWEHSTDVAAISHALARKFTTLKPDEALLAGLVHDIGALPILARSEDVPELAGDPCALDEVIDKLHASVGRVILEAWKFPPELVDVAAQHEDLMRIPDKIAYVDVVLVANLHSYLGTDHRLTRIDWRTIPAFTVLGLTPDQSIAALEEARADVNEMKNLLAA
ncbi:MAG: HDOD domain-containing protein [Acidiferrobacterales bacterium]